MIREETMIQARRERWIKLKFHADQLEALYRAAKLEADAAKKEWESAVRAS